MNRLTAYSLRLVYLCPLALLLLAAPVLAQTVNPSPQATTGSPLPEDAAPVYQLVSEDVENASAAAQPRIIVAFTVAGAPAGDEQLVLRFAVPGALVVRSSTIDSQPATAVLQDDEMGFAWSDLPETAGEHTLQIDVVPTDQISAAGPTLSFIDAGGQTIGTILPFSAESIANLLGLANVTIAQPEGTAIPDATPTALPAAQTAEAAATATAKAISVTSTGAAEVATTQPTPPPAATTPAFIPPPATAMPATATPESGGGLADGIVPWLIGGLFVLAALAIVGLLLTRRRPPRAAPARAASARAPVVALPPAGAETVTGVLMPTYLQLEGDAPQSFAINETPFAIGRGPDNNLVIDETFPQWQTVSREHALISRHERGYLIEDLGSQNGVRVNGRPTPKNLLRNGWQVSIGGVNFRFIDETQTN